MQSVEEPANAHRPMTVKRWIRRRLKFAREFLHATTISRWHWYPRTLPASRRPSPNLTSAPNPKIAYFIWHFPVLSQTFVRREIEALRKHGVRLETFAEEPEDVELLSEKDTQLVASTTYLMPHDAERLERYRRQFRRERPLLYRHVYLYIMSRRYGSRKTLGHDRDLFERAIMLAGLFREAGIDRVHSPWGDRSGFAAMLAAKLLDVPFSLQVRAHDLHDPGYHRALREMFAGAEFVITNTQYNRPFIEALMPDGGCEIRTIYNGIDLREFNPPNRSVTASRPVRLLCVARLVEQKGLTYLLDACALLRERNISFTCDVIGGTEEPLYTEYWEQVQRKHKQLGLERQVLFLGAQPFSKVMSAYCDADIFVLPCVIAKDSRRDITPNAVIEAMAMKLPVVSTPVTGLPEIVENEVSGLLVEPENSVAVADVIERLINDPALARTLGENARKRIEQRFDADRNVAERAELFRKPPATTAAPHTEPSQQISWQES